MEPEMEPESKFIEANGITLHGLSWGNPDNPLLIMTHGIGLCAQVWNPLAQDLARRLSRPFPGPAGTRG